MPTGARTDRPNIGLKSNQGSTGARNWVVRGSGFGFRPANLGDGDRSWWARWGAAAAPPDQRPASAVASAALKAAAASNATQWPASGSSATP